MRWIISNASAVWAITPRLTSTGKQLLAWNEWRSQGDPARQRLRFLSLPRTWGGLRCHTVHSLAKGYVTALQTSTPGSQKWGFLAPSLAPSETLLSGFWECAAEMSEEQSYLSLLFLINDTVTISKKSKTESQITTPLKGINSCSIRYLKTTWTATCIWVWAHIWVWKYPKHIVLSW